MTMHGPHFDWRDEPQRLSLYSLSLLALFVGAALLILYVALVIEPWRGDSVTYMDARTYADRGLTPLPPEQVAQPQ